MTLIDLIASWPHEHWPGDGATDPCKPTCRRCQVEAWARGWVKGILEWLPRVTHDFVIKQLLGLTGEED